MALRKGVIIAIENEYDTFVGSGIVLKQFIEELDAENVKVIWDPCNVVFDYSSEPAFPDGYEAVKDLIGLVHVTNTHDIFSRHSFPTISCFYHVLQGSKDYILT